MMDSVLTPAEAFREALRLVGSQEVLAGICGKRQSTISKRIRKGKPAEPDEVRAIEGATGIPRHVLRPDLYPRDDDPAESDPATRFEAAR